MIHSKRELAFYLMADRMMNRGYFKMSLWGRMKRFFAPDYIMDFLEAMRKYSYAKSSGKNRAIIFWRRFRYNRLSVKLGFSIGEDCFGYGLVIPHWGTIVVGPSNRFGNFCVLHTSTCITDHNKQVGDALYLSSGAKVVNRISLGNNVTIGANSFLNSSFSGGCLLVGMPAVKKMPREAWYIHEHSIHEQRVKSVEELKRKMGILNDK